MNSPSQIDSLSRQSRNSSTGTSGFVPIRLDAISRLGEPGIRREGYLLSTLFVGVLLANEVNWWDNKLTPFKAVNWALSHSLPYRRARRALDKLTEKSLTTFSIQPFRPGNLEITPREDEKSLLHLEARKHERFVPISRSGLSQILLEHSLSWSAASMLVLLLFLCDHNSAKLPEGWTKTKISNQFGIGWRTLSAGLDALENAGLISFNASRGKEMTLELLARSALVEPCAPTPLQRGPKRAFLNQKIGKNGPAADLARKIINHYRLEAAPSPTLIRALGEVLATGASGVQVLNQITSLGSLNGSRDPVAVLVTRVRSVTESFRLAQVSKAKSTSRRETIARNQKESEERERLDHEQYQNESRWLAQTIDKLPTPENLGLKSELTARPVFVASRIHSMASDIVTKYPYLDPSGLIIQLEKNKFQIDLVDVENLPLRQFGGSPPGTLPTERAGPTLLSRVLKSANQ